MRHYLPLGLFALAVAAPARADEPLEAPRRLEAAGKAIDVEVGHAAPCVTDWDGDGTLDLLVGQFGDGRLHIHRASAGGPGEPRRLAASEWFKAGGEIATIPAG